MAEEERLLFKMGADMSAYKCPVCGFVQMYSVMRASDAEVFDNTAATAHQDCPNDGTPLMRLPDNDEGDDMPGQMVKGISLPLGDTHFAEHLAAGPEFKGKGTYQFAKITKALDVIPADRRGLALDIGGHVGLWSRVLAHHFKRVVAFEPLPVLRAHFEVNTADCPNVQLISFAVSNKDDELDIMTVADNSGNGYVAVPVGQVGISGPFAHRTQCIRLDSLNMHGVDFVKIDVEGWELQVIQGAQRTIQRDHPVMVVEQKPNNAERYGVKQRAAVELLQSWGASIFWEKAGDVCMGWSN